MRTRGLEVEESFRLDLGEPLGLPRLGQVAARERRPLTAVVPPTKSGDQDRLA